jgi:DNA-binding transcriptional LysR family regulator
VELRQLRYLVAIADEQSFTKAAARERVAQPALSQQIRRLEAELDTTLLDRTTRRVAITASGAALIARARRVLAELEDGLAELAQMADLTTGSVAIGVTETPGAFDVQALLVDFHSAHPGVGLMVREDLTVQLVDALRADELDLAIVTDSQSVDYTGLEVVAVATEPLVAVVGLQHRFAKRRRVRLSDLRDDSFIAFGPGATIRSSVETAAHACGFQPRVTCETREASRARSLAQAGLGVAILPRSDATTAADRLRILDVTDPGLDHIVSVAWRKTRRLSPAAEALRQRALRDSAQA